MLACSSTSPSKPKNICPLDQALRSLPPSCQCPAQSVLRSQNGGIPHQPRTGRWVCFHSTNYDYATASRLSPAGILQSPYAESVDYQPRLTWIYDGQSLIQSPKWLLFPRSRAASSSANNRVAQTSKSAVSPTSKSAGRGQWGVCTNIRRFGNPRYGRLGSLRYGPMASLMQPCPRHHCR